MMIARAVYFDIETAGLGTDAPIIQLAALAVDEATGVEHATFEQKITFDAAGEHVEAAALAMNHYDAEVWRESGVPEAAACQRFAGFLEAHKCLAMTSRGGRPYKVAKLIGHNAATFDGPRLFAMFKRTGAFLPADPRVLCTLQRALWYFAETGLAPPENYKLATLCRAFGVAHVDAHDALGDVRATVALARAIQRVARVPA